MGVLYSLSDAISALLGDSEALPGLALIDNPAAVCYTLRGMFHFPSHNIGTERTVSPSQEPVFGILKGLNLQNHIRPLTDNNSSLS